MATNIEELANKVTVARREGRLSAAQSDAEMLVELCRNNTNKESLASALMMLGQIERDRSKKSSALQHYEEAVAICREVADTQVIAHTVRHLADLFCEEAMFDLAEKCFDEVLTLYRSDPNTAPANLANAIRGYAVLKDATDDHEAAMQLWQEARELYLDLGIDAGVAECDSRLS